MQLEDMGETGVHSAHLLPEDGGTLTVLLPSSSASSSSVS